jgi:hypothetical protein
MYAIIASLFTGSSEPFVETLLVYTDTSADVQHTKIFGSIAKIVGGTLADGQHRSDIIYTVNK